MKISNVLCFLCSFSFWSCFLASRLSSSSSSLLLLAPLLPPRSSADVPAMGDLDLTPHLPESHTGGVELGMFSSLAACCLSPGICLSFISEVCLVMLGMTEQMFRMVSFLNPRSNFPIWIIRWLETAPYPPYALLGSLFS